MTERRKRNIEVGWSEVMEVRGSWVDGQGRTGKAQDGSKVRNDSIGYNDVIY